MPDRRLRLGESMRALLRRRPPEIEETLDDRIERTIAEAREQHRLVVDQAAVIVAGQARAGARLERAVGEYEQVTADAQEALVMADRRAQEGDAEAAEIQRRAAAASARRMVALELEIEELRKTALEATEASDAAREAVAQSAALLRTRLEERERLLTRLDQARLQEQVNAAREQLDRGVGEGVPDLEQTRRSIDERLAVARALAEIRPGTIDEVRLERRQAEVEEQTRAKLDVLRGPLGLDAGVGPAHPPPSPGQGPSPEQGRGR